MPVILALDQGTTSTRTIVVDEDGRPLATAQRELTQHFPTHGWVEHDPQEIWEAQRATMHEALAAAGRTAADVAAVGITNQRETTVVWDRATGEPIAPAIVWQDRRTAVVCEQLEADGHLDPVRQCTGLLLDPYFSGTKVAWLLDHVEGARARAERGTLAFGTIDTWLAWQLTGGAAHVTDPSNASRTLLFDIHAGAWSEALCELLRVPRSMLPEVVPSSGVCGELDEASGLPGAPIAGIAGDQQAALFGQRCTRPGLAKNTYGTGCFLLQNTGGTAIAPPPGLLGTVAWQLADEPLTYAQEGAVFVGGAAVQWLRDGLKLIHDSAEVEALARSVDDDGGVVVVPAFAGLGAPHWDPWARGAVFGITRGTTDGHLARAVLQGIAFQVADLIETIGRRVATPLASLRVDGGAAANDLLLQFQADLLGIPVERPRVLESTALGAAGLAGLGVGLWRADDELDAHHAIERVFEPAADPDQLAAQRARWKRGVERAAGWAREDA